PDEKAKVLELLKDLKFGGTVAANGAANGLKLHLDSAEPSIQVLLSQIGMEMLPIWPVLPAEPVGLGAKWQVTATTKFAGKLDITETSDYELVDHKGPSWTIKATTKVSGSDQDIDSSRASNIKGDGTVEVALADGALYPKTTNKV